MATRLEGRAGPVPDAQLASSRWRTLYRLGGAAALLSALGLLGVALFITSNPAFEMLSLSGQYAGAATDAQRSAFLAAGEATLATWQGTAFQVAYLLGSVAGIAIVAVMLRGGSFGRVTAWSAILGNAVGLGLYAPGIGVYIAVFSVVFLEVWYVLVARRLLRLGLVLTAATKSGAGR